MLSYDKIKKGIEIPYTVKDKVVHEVHSFKVIRIGFAYVVVQQ